MVKRGVLVGVMCLSLVLSNTSYTAVWAANTNDLQGMQQEVPTVTATSTVDLTKSAGAKVEFEGTSREDGYKDPQVIIKSGVTDPRFATDYIQKGNTNEGKTSSFIIDLGKVSTLTSGSLSYFFKAYPTEYTIEVSTNKSEWKTVKTFTKQSNGTTDPVDTYDMPANTQGRYVRVTYKKMNEGAGADYVIVKAVTVMGEGESTIPPSNQLQGANAQAMMTNFTQITQPSIDDTQVTLPTVPEGYTISVKGSDVENVVTNTGVITQHNIASREVPIIVQIENKTNASDRAEKSFTLTVPGKESKNKEVYKEVANANEKPGVIPTLQEWYGYEGDFQLSKSSRIVIADKANVNLEKVANSMKKDIKEFTGYDLAIVKAENNSAVTTKDIYIESTLEDNYDLGDEGYYIINGEKGIQISAKTYTGALYGTITIEQILWQNKEELKVPKGVIRDYPKYAIRGIMLDIARTPYRMQQLEDYAKMLSWYKINEYHLHINDNFFDDSGDKASFDHWNKIESMFRLESSTFPSLKTDKKEGSQYDYFNNIYENPHYTKEEWKNLQSLAKDNGIKVITEIDAPGHSALFTKYAKKNPDNIDWFSEGIHRTENWEQLALEGAKGATANRFIQTLMKDYIVGENPTFTTDTVHIGADEYWKIKDSERPGMKNYIVDMHKLLKDNNKKTRMWGHIKEYIDSTNMNTASLNDIELDVWYLPYENLERRLKEGYKVINVDQAILYGNPGRDKRDIVNVEYLFDSWEPNQFNGKSVAKGEPNLIGAKTALWADINRKGYIEKDFHERVLHQAAVLAEKTWGGTKATDTYEEYEFKFGKLKEGPGTNIAMNIDSDTDKVVDYDFANFDASSKRIYDESGNAYDAKVTGGNVVNKDGQSYLRFDGNTKIETNLKTLGYPYTVSFDVRIDSTDENNKEASLFSGYDGRLQTAGVDGEMSINRSYFQQSLGYTIPKNKKVSVSIVGTAQGTKVYIDGKLKNFVCREVIGDETNYNDIATTFVFPLEEIGKGFKGYLANIQAYKKALSPEAVSALYSGETMDKVNVAQNVPAAGDSQAKGEAGFDNRDKKLCVGWKAVDGDGKNLLGGYTGISSEPDSRWLGGSKVDSTLSLDLLQQRAISEVRIQWNAPGFAKGFKIQTSVDGKTWVDSKVVTDNTSDLSNITFETPVNARYLRMVGTAKNGQNNYSIQEIEVFEKATKKELENLIYKAEYYKKEHNLTFVNPSKPEFFKAYVNATSVSESPIATAKEVEEAKTKLQTEMNNLPQITIPEDKEAPKAPTELVASDVTNNTATITWKASTDNVKVKHYEVTMGDTTRTVKNTGISFEGLTKNTSYTVVIKAVDGVDNKSEVAQLVFKTANQLLPEELPTTSMTATAGSAQSGNEAAKAIDKDENTIWHTSWEGADRSLHHLTLALDGEYDVSGFTYLPRKSGGTNGTITKYEIQTSMDGTTFTKVAEGNWANNTSNKEVTFNSVKAKFVRLVSVDSVSDNATKKFSSASEVRVIGMPHQEESNQITGIVLNKDTATMKVGEELTLTASVQPEGNTNPVITWTSSDEAVATVVNGKVTAKKAGNVTIKANVGKFTAQCTITVQEKTDTTVDKSKLKQVIETAKKVEKDKYTEDSYNAMKKALDAAIVVDQKTTATAKEVEDATTKLNTAVGALIVKNDGWVKEDGKDRYYENGKPVSNKWIQNADKAWLFAGADGFKVVDWKEIGKVWYYFDPNGKMETGWLNLGGTWYYLEESGAMVTGWKLLSGQWFYLNSSGAMMTGWTLVNGSWYYMNSSGVMVTGWNLLGGQWYYLDASGKMATGWALIDGNWYYFNGSGVMAAGWTLAGANWYYLDGNGKMLTGWQVINGQWYYLKGNGEMATGWTYDGNKTYYLDTITGAWNGQVR